MLRAKALLRVRLTLPLGAFLLSLLSPAAPAAETAGAKAPAMSPFEVAKVAGKTWIGRFGLSNCAWIDLGSGVLLVDTGASAADAANLKAEITKSVGSKPVKWIVITHLHEHANAGLPAFLSSAPTIYIRASVAANTEAALARMARGGTPPKVVGVRDTALIAEGGLSVKVFAPAGGSATAVDLWVLSSDAKVAFVGDLLTGGQCPSLLDPDSDPIGWSAELQRVGAQAPLLVQGSVGDISNGVEGEIATTRAYLERIYRITKEIKGKGLPEARVSSQLSVIEKVGDYCSTKVDVMNGLAIYKRLGPDGTLRKGAPQPPPQQRP